MVAAATGMRLEWAVLALGAALAALAVTGWRIEGGVRAPAARLAIVTAPNTDLALTPAGETRVEAALRAGGPESGIQRQLEIRNATANPVEVHVTAATEARELEQALQLRVQAGTSTLFQGSLAELRVGSNSFRLPSHETTEVTVLAWIPKTAPHSWEARSDSLRIGFTTTPTT